MPFVASMHTTWRLNPSTSRFFNAKKSSSYFIEYFMDEYNLLWPSVVNQAVVCFVLVIRTPPTERGFFLAGCVGLFAVW